MFMRIDHIGIVTDDLEKIKTFYREALGMEPSHEETREALGVRAALYPVGETALEYVEPITADSPVRKFLETHGGGIHHVCLLVDDIRAVLRTLEERGVRLIDAEPRAGTRNRLIAFLHPKSTHGVLIELAQET